MGSSMSGVRFDPERLEVRTLLRHAPVAGADALEIGCGDGRLTRRIAGAVGRVVGIDPDAEQITRARQLTSRNERRRVHFRTGSGEHLPFPANRFNLVLFSWSL